MMGHAQCMRSRGCCAQLAFRLRSTSVAVRPAYMATKAFKVQDVDAGHEYVEAYVTFIHSVDGMYEAAMNPASGQYPEGATVPYENK